MNVCDASSIKTAAHPVQCLTVLESAGFSRKEKQGKSYLFCFHYTAVVFITPLPAAV
jgi:hypothetical protein